MRKALYFLFLYYFFTSFVKAQGPIVAPIEFNHVQAEYQKKFGSLKITALTDTINFPFFDDFTTSTVVPDPALWIQNEGTFINNSYALNPPNYNVASFDGLRFNGVPYAPGTTQTGETDKLTSRPIDLSGLVNGNTIYLNFYWQGDGIGEPADPNRDSIRLRIKDKFNNWVKVWSETQDNTPGFQYQKIAINNPNFFYKGFQFAFESFGRRSGPYDVWNIDYVMLDTGRLAQDTWSPDISFMTLPNSLLKKYTAMPFSQFRLSELSDTVKTTLRSLFNKDNSIEVEDNSGNVTNIKTGAVIDFLPTSILNLAAFGLDTYIWEVDPAPFTALNNESIVKYKFQIDTASKNGGPGIGQYYGFTTTPGDSIQSRIDFKRNDSISGITYLTDYFAYDDGSAEFGWGINIDDGKVAIKYELNEADTLTHIDICFPRMGTYLNTAESITLMIWSSIGENTSNETLVSGETVLLNYTTNLNSFNSYQLSEPVILNAGTFYVGYKQFTSNQILAGFDKNNDARPNIFYNTSGIWRRYTDENGAVMIRPVFRSKTLTSVNKKTDELNVTVYPNPSSGEFFIAGDAKEVFVYDLSGRLVYSDLINGNNNTTNMIDLSSLSNGFYFMHLINGDKKSVKKVILNR